MYFNYINYRYIYHFMFIIINLLFFHLIISIIFYIIKNFIYELDFVIFQMIKDI